MKFWKKCMKGKGYNKLMVRVSKTSITMSKGLVEALKSEFVAIGYEDEELPIFYIFPIQKTEEFTDSYSPHRGRISLRAFIRNHNIPLGKYDVERFGEGYKVLVCLSWKSVMEL